MLKKTIRATFLSVAAAGGMFIIPKTVTSANINRLPKLAFLGINTASLLSPNGLKALFITGLIGGLTANAFKNIGLPWLEGPLVKSLEPGDHHEAKEALEKYHRRRMQASMAAALVTYFAAGLGVTIAYHGGGSAWVACVKYLRAHLLDGFGCAGFFTVGWSQMDRHSKWADELLSLATAGIAAAAAFVAGGTSTDVVVISFLGYVFGYRIWGSITRHLGDEMDRAEYRHAVLDWAARRYRPENPAGGDTGMAGPTSPCPE